MWLLLLILVPVAILGLLALAAAAMVALVVAIVTHLGPLLIIAFGGWLLLRAINGSDHYRRPRADVRAGRRAHHRSGGPRGDGAPRQPAQAQQPARTPAAPPRRQLPIDVQVKVEQIRHKADLLLSYADRFSPFSQDLYIVRQTAADYLPRTIAVYLAIPGLDDPLIGATGRTALQELRAQLQILDGKLDEITQNLQRQDLDGLLANRRFLEERFGLPEQTPRAESGPRKIEAA